MTQSLTALTPELHVQLLLDKTKNNLNLTETIFKKLFHELPNQLIAIKNALENNQLSEAKDITHILHGSASFCGLQAIQNPAKQLEKSLLAANSELAAKNLNILTQQVNALTDQQFAILKILSNLN